MAKTKINYDQASIFTVPLEGLGYCLGVVARCDRRGSIFGYFFGPLLKDAPTTHDGCGLTPSRAIFAGQFGDLGMLTGEWKVIGRVSPWVPAEWPMPDLVTPIPERGQWRVAKYDEKSLSLLSHRYVPWSPEVEALPRDGGMGYKYAEAMLVNLLKGA